MKLTLACAVILILIASQTFAMDDTNKEDHLRKIVAKHHDTDQEGAPTDLDLFDPRVLIIFEEKKEEEK